MNSLAQPESRIGESWQHQVDGYHFVRGIFNRAQGNAGAGLFFDMGTGKTRTAIHLLDNSRAVRKVLVIAPKKVVPVWPGQFAEHSPHPHRRVLAPSGKTVRDRAMEIADAVEDFEGKVMDGTSQLVIAINYESAWREPMATTLLHCGFDIGILDEAHRLKAPGSQTSKYFARLGKRIPYRLALTGTPLPHSPLDAWAMYRFLDSRIFPKYLCWNRKKRASVCPPDYDHCCFRKRYAIMGGFENKVVVEYRNLDELHEKMFSIAVRVKKEDVLDLPPQTHVDRRFSLKPKVKKMYEELEDELYTQLDDGEVTPANALVKLIRLAQITSGHIKLDDGRLREVHNDKEELFADLLEDFALREPIVVFYRFREDAVAIRRAVEKSGRRYGEVSGDRDDTVGAAFVDNCDVLGAQIQAGGVGVDFKRAAYAIFFSVGWSLAEYDQALSRLHRGGQTRPVTYYHLIARDTVDARVYWALQKRREIVESVLTKMREASRIAS